MELFEVQDDSEYKAELNRQMRSLAKRSRSIAETRSRLLERDLQMAVVESIISDLVKAGFLDDRRYAGEFCRSKLRQGFGPLRIRRQLLEHGVPESYADEALRNEEHDFPELDLLRAVLAKRLRNVGEPATPVQLKNLLNFLKRRGFHFELIRSELDAYYDRVFSDS